MKILYGPAAEAVRGHPVVVVEDIIDTGITTAAVLKHLERLEPASLEVCALLDKPSRRRVDARARFVGITIPDRFVVGYGMDLDQRYRQLPGISLHRRRRRKSMPQQAAEELKAQREEPPTADRE